MLTASSEPAVEEVREALAALAGKHGEVPPGVARRLAEERGWGGRAMDVLAVLTEDVESMAYLAGGRHPDEIAAWLELWTTSSLSLEQIRLVVADRGWDPEPFAVLAGAGLLEHTLVAPDGSPRVIHGELAGGWVSDELALADDAEVVRRVLDEIGEEPGPAGPLPQEEYEAVYAKVPRLTVEVVVTSGAGVLLTRRQSGPCKGLWHIPGGTVRLGERLTDAVARVARSELGMQVVAGEMLGYIEYPSHLRQGLGWPVGIAFSASPVEASSGERLELEREGAGWFSKLPDEIHDEQRDFLSGRVLGDC